MAEKLYTQKEVAEMFNVTTQTIYRWRKAGKISATKIGKNVMFTTEEINRTIKENQEKGANNEKY